MVSAITSNYSFQQPLYNASPAANIYYKNMDNVKNTETQNTVADSVSQNPVNDSVVYQDNSLSSTKSFLA